MHFASCNETFWCGESVHIPVVGKMELICPLLRSDANFVMFFPFALLVAMGEFIMLGITPVFVKSGNSSWGTQPFC